MNVALGAIVSLSIAWAVPGPSAAMHAPTEDPRTIVAAMAAADETIRSGKSSDAAVGQYVIVLAKVPSNDPQGVDEARQDAMKQIGEYLGVQVESVTESGYRESKGADGISESKSYFRDYSAAHVNLTLGAVDMIGLAKQDGRTVAGFMLSEGGARRMQAMSDESAKALKAKKDGKPLEVDATGLAMIVGGDQAKAQRDALEVAKRNALEMAMGASVIGLTILDRDDAGVETFRKTCFSTTEGGIAAFQVLEEGSAGDCYRVRIRAVVQQGKLLDNYRSHLRSLGDPVFCIDASGNVDLQRLANDFFQSKGFRIHEGGGCRWTIQLRPAFTTREDPRNTTRTGTQCVISGKLTDSATGEVSADVGATAKGFDSMDGGDPVQRRRSVEMAFRNMREELHRKIDESIVRLAREGRPFTVTIAGLGGVDDVTMRLTQALALRPGVNDPEVSLREGEITIRMKTLLPNDLLAKFVGSDACALVEGSSARLVTQGEANISITVERVAR